MQGAFPTGTDTGGRPGRFVPPKIEELAAKFPQLEILGFIGQGGMGAVYKTRQKQLDRVVALKILPPQTVSDPGFAERFAREARALAQLNHPHIVVLYEFGQADGLFYFLMEHVDGINLRALLQAGRLAPKEALAIVPQICEALEYAHERGIVHRDIKPENILLSKQGQVKIADFGVAKIVVPGADDVAGGPSPAPGGELTGAGGTVGTLQYMAPEQIKNSSEVDHRADIYSLGVVFYQMLTGELPEGKIEPPSKKVQIDVRLDEVVLRALEKKPELRYQQAGALKTEVETIAQTMQAGGTAPAADFIQAALARDYSLDINHCLNRAWKLVTGDFWPMVGVSALIWLLTTIATSSLVGIIVRYPLIGGLWLYYLNRVRGNPVTLETAFSGFKVAFLQLILAGLIAKLLMFLGFICLIIPGIYLWVAWTFAVALVADQHLDFWPAMQLSRKVVGRHWWKFFWFLIVLALIHLAGILLCYVGIFAATPICLAALAYAYEDIFGPAAKAPASPASAPLPSAPARGGTSLAVAFGIAAGAAAVVVFIALIGLAAAIAIPNFVRAREQQALAIHDQQLAEQSARGEQERRLKELKLGAAPRPSSVVKSDYIGQTYFPNGDSIEIASVDRTSDRMVVKGHFHLVSASPATLALRITATNGVTGQPGMLATTNVERGEGDFALTETNIVPGLPHVGLISTTGRSFAEVYFGTREEAGEEAKLSR
jgi:tRNA A-37 threonylcarbamoyl transferase component Bud32/type II secretory pathway pseudopilin PulG